MTIKDIHARKNILIKETQALQLLRIKNTSSARDWLRMRLPYQIGQFPRHTVLYAVGDVDRLKVELVALALLSKP